MTTKVARTRGELAEALAELREPASGLPEGTVELGEALAVPRGGGRTAALVPTMGAFTDAHIALIRRAHEVADAVVVSIFVNPTQFGPGEDFDRYPRPFETDLEKCQDEGVALVFAPTTEVIYPERPAVTVNPGEMGRVLEGATRSGHFEGVLTIVMKLFNLVRPDFAIFGEKDAQQLALISRMVRDLDLPVRIVAAPIEREPDGLALSSRNVYLSAEDRETALVLSRALSTGAAAADRGPDAIRKEALAVVNAEPGLRLDYLALVDPDTFGEIGTGYRGPAILAVAGKVGTTRLIDNTRIIIS